MKILIITDTHLGVRNDSPTIQQYFSKSFSWLFDYIDHNQVDAVVHMGDLFDRRKYLQYKTSYACRKDYLEPLNDRGIETHIMAGNHDHYHKNDYRINSLNEIVTGRYPNITTYVEPATVNVAGLDILFVPWIDDSKPQHFYDTIKDSKAEILMGHLAINGFEMDNGNIAHGGDDRKIFDRFDLVFSGHFHHRSSQGNIHYLGAFAEHTWSDYNDPRGFTIFDTETRQQTFMRNPYSMFKMISYDDVKDKEIIETVKNTDYSDLKDCYVKIVCVNRTNPYAFDMLIDKIYKVSPVDISVVEDFQTFTELEESAQEEVNQSEPTPKILDKYISGLTLPVDNDRMKVYMNEIYNEAISMEHTE